VIHIPCHFGERASFAPLDRLSRLALGYLALPVFLYFCGWFKPLPGALLSMLLGYACWRALSDRALASPAPPWPRKRLIALTLLVAIAWSVFGGAGHFFYSNANDWAIRDAVLRDLVSAPWPPTYDAGGADALILRAPVAYYLPAAAIAKVTGLATADKLLWLWTVIGITLFFLLLPLRHTSVLRSAVALSVIVMFSGMDILGLMFPDFHWGNVPLPGAFIDWWIKPPPLVGYWSNTANLFWSPNHCLPAWISIALFYRHWRHQGFLSVALLLVALLPLWSPFTLIGLAPFQFMLILHWWPKRHSDSLDIPVAITCLSVFGVIFAALVIPLSSISYGMTLTTPPERGSWIYLGNLNHVLTYVENYTLFVIFEFAVIALLVSRAVDRWLYSTAVLTLLVLPFFSIGPGNDLSMRASIPSLGVLCIAAANMIAYPSTQTDLYRRIGLGLALIVGTVTPYHEFYRAIFRKSWEPNLDFTLIDSTNGEVDKLAHYLVQSNRSSVSVLLNHSAPMPNAVNWLYYCKKAHPRTRENFPTPPFVLRPNRNDEEINIERNRRQCADKAVAPDGSPKTILKDEATCP
jgi:hypothetical protein